MNVNLITPKAKKEERSSFSISPIHESSKSPHNDPNESEMQRMIRKKKIDRGWTDIVGTPDFNPNPKSM